MNLKPIHGEGRQAARAGQKPTANPYKGAYRGRTGMRRAAWMRGFRSVEADRGE